MRPCPGPSIAPLGGLRTHLERGPHASPMNGLVGESRDPLQYSPTRQDGPANGPGCITGRDEHVSSYPISRRSWRSVARVRCLFTPCIRPRDGGPECGHLASSCRRRPSRSANPVVPGLQVVPNAGYRDWHCVDSRDTVRCRHHDREVSARKYFCQPGCGRDLSDRAIPTPIQSKRGLRCSID